MFFSNNNSSTVVSLSIFKNEIPQISINGASSFIPSFYLIPGKSVFTFNSPVFVSNTNNYKSPVSAFPDPVAKSPPSELNAAISGRS